MFTLTFTVPSQNALDYFKAVLEFHNQLAQQMPEEQLTEVRDMLDCLLFFKGFSE